MTHHPANETQSHRVLQSQYRSSTAAAAVAQAAREVANTIAHSANRVFLNADSLLLNLGELDTRGGMK